MVKLLFAKSYYRHSAKALLFKLSMVWWESLQLRLKIFMDWFPFLFKCMKARALRIIFDFLFALTRIMAHQCYVLTYILVRFYKIRKMPRRRGTLGRISANARRMREERQAETAEERENRLERSRSFIRANRDAESDEMGAARRQEQQARSAMRRNAETSPERLQRQAIERNRRVQSRERIQLNMAVFNYDPNYDYENHPNVTIGQMDKICQHCQAMKFAKESPGMCCSNGKVKLMPVNEPPQALLKFFGSDPLSKHFLGEIRKYNSCFQMTSFGATRIASMPGYMPTFRVQGQVYHTIGSLLPAPEHDRKYLQIYFMGNEQQEIDRRCAVIPGARRAIVTDIQRLLHEQNQLVRLFKTALDQMPADEYRVVIRADKAPANEHAGRFNAPTFNEVAIVMVGQEFERRDIIIRRRDASIHRIAETHRSYDALQYPLIFCRGEDGYHFNIKQIDPYSHEPTNKKVCLFNNKIITYSHA